MREFLFLTFIIFVMMFVAYYYYIKTLELEEKMTKLEEIIMLNIRNIVNFDKDINDLKRKIEEMEVDSNNDVQQ